MRIPKIIKVNNLKIKVIQTTFKNSKKLGCLNEKRDIIFIKKDLPNIGKVIILIHELLHFVDLLNVESKSYKRRLTESQIKSTAGVLTLILLQNNLLQGVSLKQIERFIENDNRG